MAQPGSLMCIANSAFWIQSEPSLKHGAQDKSLYATDRGVVGSSVAYATVLVCESPRFKSHQVKTPKKGA